MNDFHVSKGLSLTPNLCTPSSSRVDRPVSSTPTHRGMPNSRLRAKAVPTTEGSEKNKKTKRVKKGETVGRVGEDSSLRNNTSRKQFHIHSFLVE